MIDILIPVLGRPANAQRVVDSITANTTVEHRITFLVTAADAAEIEAVGQTECPAWFFYDEPGHGDYARKINEGARIRDGEFFFNGADDLDFTPGWDTQALLQMKPNIGVVATNDMANRQVRRGEFGTHNLIRRDYILQRGGTREGTPGVVLHEGYDHSYVDRELCDVAQARGVYAFAKRSIVKHRHPLWRTAQWDDTYRKAVAKSRQDQELYQTRKRDIVC